MDTDHNLLCGVLALQSGLIDTGQFVEACTVWTTRKHVPLVDVLIERGWLLESDKTHLLYLLERKVQRDGGDAKLSLASVTDDIKRSLAALQDQDIQRSLADLPMREGDTLEETIMYVPAGDDRYELTRLHATGGIGRVWLARDKTLGRDVALKDLRPERSKETNLATRFLQEARITGQLEHPGIVPVYEVGQRSGGQEPFYTMRFVKGRTLAEAGRAYHERRRAGEADDFELLTLLSAFITVCKTVAYSHSRGIVHRDLKGQNVVLGEFGEVVVLDWGLAKQSAHVEKDSRGASAGDHFEHPDSNLTLDGQTIGTPAYMAPEQASGRLDLIDRRTDVYGLGAMLYEILAGEPPFSGSDTHEVLQKVRNEAPLPPSELNPNVPALLESACLKALAKSRSQRFDSASELAYEIERWQEVERKRAELALRESEMLYRSLVDMLPLLLVRKDLDSRFTFGNKRCCEVLGTTFDELIGKTDFDFFPAELAEKYRRDDSWVIETGQTFEDTEVTVHQGQRQWVQIIKTPVRDSQGKIIGTQVVCWDVSDLKRAEQALRDSEALYRSLVDALPIGLVRKDRDSRFTFGNKHFCEMWGLSPEQVPGMTDTDLSPPDVAEEYYRNDREVLATGGTIEATEPSPYGDTESYIHTTKTPVYDGDGNIIGVQVVWWDVSERMRLERRLAEATAELEEARREVEELRRR